MYFLSIFRQTLKLCLSFYITLVNAGYEDEHVCPYWEQNEQKMPWTAFCYGVFEIIFETFVKLVGVSKRTWHTDVQPV